MTQMNFGPSEVYKMVRRKIEKSLVFIVKRPDIKLPIVVSVRTMGTNVKNAIKTIKREISRH